MQNDQALTDVCQTALLEIMEPVFFKALCEPTRIALLATLASRKEPSTVSELSSCCGIDFSGVSRHLKLLKDAGILRVEKSGREVLYSLDTEGFSKTLRDIASALELCAEKST